MRNILFLLLILAALAVQSSPVRAAPPETPDSSDPNDVTVVWPNFPPWFYWEKSTAQGQDTALYENLAQRMGLTLRFASCIMKDCLDMLKQGRADLGPSMRKTPEREEYLVFLEPPIRTAAPLLLFARPGQRPVTELRDLYGKTIVVQKGMALPDILNQSRLPILVPVDTAGKALSMVLAHKADLAMLSQSEARWWMKRMGLDLELIENPLVLNNPIPLHMVLSRASRLMERKEELEKILADLIEFQAEPGAQP